MDKETTIEILSALSDNMESNVNHLNSFPYNAEPINSYLAHLSIVTMSLANIIKEMLEETPS